MTLRTAAAFHEAGHAVACIRLGGAVDRLVIDDRSGKIYYARLPQPQHAYAVTIFCGPVAQRRAVTQSPETVSDFIAIDAICGSDAGDDRLLFYREWHAHLSNAEALVDRNWKPICELAARLLSSPTSGMTGDDVMRCIRACDDMHAVTVQG